MNVMAPKLSATIVSLLSALCVVFYSTGGLFLSRPAQAQSSNGIALIIGQSDYEHLPRLENTRSDARKIEALISSLGFRTELSLDRPSNRLRGDLEAFVDDAAGTDVALIYYGGHGIEVGGENYLMPIDVDASALTQPSQQAFAISSILDKLRSRTRLTVILLDACRSNPFPRGTFGRDSQSRLVPIQASGLAAVRGASVISERSGADDSIGEIIAFAAAPGNVALDGPAGGNSPYALALLKHLPAEGLEFGQVMTLVSQEVYLLTGGRQQPWMNTSLNQFLYFGAKVEGNSSDDAQVLSERRALLLRLASTPDSVRRTVETIASANQVPLAAVYGMLDLLGVQSTYEPTQLTKQLDAGSRKLKELLAEKDLLRSSDPEIARLLRLSENAILDGALKSATAFQERAKARVAKLNESMDQAEIDLRARRIEFGEVYTRSALTNELSFEYLTAAGDWYNAWNQVEKWDKLRASAYKEAMVLALTKHGEYRGDNQALLRSIVLFADLIKNTPRSSKPLDWARLHYHLGDTLETLGIRESSISRLESAESAYQMALSALPEGSMDAASAITGLSFVRMMIAERQGNLKGITDAANQLKVASATFAAVDRAMTLHNEGLALVRIGRLQSSKSPYQSAIAAFEAALSLRVRNETPLEWAQTQIALGSAYYDLSRLDNDPSLLVKAEAAQRLALEETPRTLFPLMWSGGMHNLAAVLINQSDGVEDTSKVEEALVLLRKALEIRDRERFPLEWASSQDALGNALADLGRATGQVEHLYEAKTAHELALQVQTREALPMDWARSKNNLGAVLLEIGIREQSPNLIQQSAAAYRESLEILTFTRSPVDWAFTQNNLGWALKELGQATGSVDLIIEGKRLVLEVWQAAIKAGYDVNEYFTKRVADFDSEILQLESGSKKNTSKLPSKPTNVR